MRKHCTNLKCNPMASTVSNTYWTARKQRHRPSPLKRMPIPVTCTGFNDAEEISYAKHMRENDIEDHYSAKTEVYFSQPPYETSYEYVKTFLTAITNV